MRSLKRSSKRSSKRSLKKQIFYKNRKKTNKKVKKKRKIHRKTKRLIKGGGGSESKFDVFSTYKKQLDEDENILEFMKNIYNLTEFKEIENLKQLWKEYLKTRYGETFINDLRTKTKFGVLSDKNISYQINDTKFTLKPLENLDDLEHKNPNIYYLTLFCKLGRLGNAGTTLAHYTGLSLILNDKTDENDLGNKEETKYTNINFFRWPGDVTILNRDKQKGGSNSGLYNLGENVNKNRIYGTTEQDKEKNQTIFQNLFEIETSNSEKKIISYRFGLRVDKQGFPSSFYKLPKIGTSTKSRRGGATQPVFKGVNMNTKKTQIGVAVTSSPEPQAYKDFFLDICKLALEQCINGEFENNVELNNVLLYHCKSGLDRTGIVYAITQMVYTVYLEYLTKYNSSSLPTNTASSASSASLESSASSTSSGPSVTTPSGPTIEPPTNEKIIHKFLELFDKCEQVKDSEIEQIKVINLNKIHLGDAIKSHTQSFISTLRSRSQDISYKNITIPDPFKQDDNDGKNIFKIICIHLLMSYQITLWSTGFPGLKWGLNEKKKSLDDFMDKIPKRIKNFFNNTLSNLKELNDYMEEIDYTSNPLACAIFTRSHVGKGEFKEDKDYMLPFWLEGLSKFRGS